MIQRLTNFLFEAGTLRKIARGHRQAFLTDDLSDNIASHSHRVSVIGYFISKMENANVEKVLEMCIFHDIAETRSGDQTWIHKRYVTVDEDRILAEQLSNISKDDEIKKVMSEYLKRESLEAKVAKDADNIDQYLLVKEYDHRGNKEASSWLAKDVTNLLGLD